MNDNKIFSYTVKWTQPYPYATDFIFIDLTASFEEAVEQELDAGEFTQALEVINMIRSK